VSNQEQTTPTTPATPVDEVISPADAIGILGRLIPAFQFAVKANEEDRNKRFWTVSGQIGGSADVNSFDGYEELCAFIADCRESQNEDRENEHFLFIFRGSRLKIQKGRRWSLCDGDVIVPIDAPAYTVVDDTGSLLDNQDLDSVELPVDEVEDEEEDEPLDSRLVPEA
jgi:hypothetical protein